MERERALAEQQGGPPLDNRALTAGSSASGATVSGSASLAKRVLHYILDYIGSLKEAYREKQELDLEQILESRTGFGWVAEIIIHNKYFDMVMGTVICLNVVIMVLQANENAACASGSTCETSSFLKATGYFFLAVYSLELVVRLTADRMLFFCSSWNLLDFIVVITGWMDTVLTLAEGAVELPGFNVLRVFRVMRLLRAVRLMRFFPSLAVMITSFISVMKAMTWGIVLVFLFLIIFSIATLEIVGPKQQALSDSSSEWCNEAFSSVYTAVLFFFQVFVAGDSWGTCAIPLLLEDWWLFSVFGICFFVVEFGIMNLVLSAILDCAAESHEQDVEARMNEVKSEKEKAIEKMNTVFRAIDANKNGFISSEEMMDAWENKPKVQEMFSLHDIHDKEEMSQLFRYMDKDRSDTVSIDEFTTCMRRAMQQDIRMQMMCVKLHLESIQSNVERSFERVEHKIGLLSRGEEVAAPPKTPEDGEAPAGAPAAADEARASGVGQTADTEDLQALWEVFQARGASRDGSINLRELIKACGQRPEVAAFFGLLSEIHQEGAARRAVMEFFQAADTNSDREVTWEELCRSYHERGRASSPRAPRLRLASRGTREAQAPERERPLARLATAARMTSALRSSAQRAHEATQPSAAGAPLAQAEERLREALARPRLSELEERAVGEEARQQELQARRWEAQDRRSAAEALLRLAENRRADSEPPPAAPRAAAAARARDGTLDTAAPWAASGALEGQLPQDAERLYRLAAEAETIASQRLSRRARGGAPQDVDVLHWIAAEARFSADRAFLRGRLPPSAADDPSATEPSADAHRRAGDPEGGPGRQRPDVASSVPAARRRQQSGEQRQQRPRTPTHPKMPARAAQAAQAVQASWHTAAAAPAPSAAAAPAPLPPPSPAAGQMNRTAGFDLAQAAVLAPSGAPPHLVLPCNTASPTVLAPLLLPSSSSSNAPPTGLAVQGFHVHTGSLPVLRQHAALQGEAWSPATR